MKTQIQLWKINFLLDFLNNEKKELLCNKLLQPATAWLKDLTQGRIWLSRHLKGKETPPTSSTVLFNRVCYSQAVESVIPQISLFLLVTEAGWSSSAGRHKKFTIRH